jgi:hypothetical protein
MKQVIIVTHGAELIACPTIRAAAKVIGCHYKTLEYNLTKLGKKIYTNHRNGMTAQWAEVADTKLSTSYQH